MNRRHMRRPLAWGLAATILLPVVLALLLGLGRLLNALGDEAGAVACDRVALLAGVLWALAVVATTIINAAINATLLVQLGGEPAAGGSRRRQERRGWQRAGRGWKRRLRYGQRRRRHPAEGGGRYHDRTREEDSDPGAMP